jgi:hypothetical protein
LTATPLAHTLYPMNKSSLQLLSLPEAAQANVGRRQFSSSVKTRTLQTVCFSDNQIQPEH